MKLELKFMRATLNNQESLALRIKLQPTRVMLLHSTVHLKDMMSVVLIMLSEWLNLHIREEKEKDNHLPINLLHME